MKRKLCVLCVLCGDIVFFIPEGAETFIWATEVTESTARLRRNQNLKLGSGPHAFQKSPLAPLF
jgi:hypothetical protein